MAQSTVLMRVSGVLAAAPILFCITAHVFLHFGRISHQKKGWEISSWRLVQIGIVLFALSKYLAIPFGIALLLLGLVFSNIDVSIAGVAALTLAYSANVGSWGAAGRLRRLLRMLPDILHMNRWHVDGRGMPYTFDSSKPDLYERNWKDFKRLLVRANEEDEPPSLLWWEEVIIVVLIFKFVTLSDQEIKWTPGTAGPLGDESVNILVRSLRRFEKGWEGKPGTYVKEYTHFVSDPANPARETTLRFVVMLFELICRNAVRDRLTMVYLMNQVVQQERYASGSMHWVHTLFWNCMTKGTVLQNEGASQ